MEWKAATPAGTARAEAPGLSVAREKAEAVPAESVCLERKSTASNEKSEYENELIVLILAIKIRKDFFSALLIGAIIFVFIMKDMISSIP
ncbi:hypothetical protein CW357_04225 [Rummeliibacillus sp. TYF005]|nr:hypothetical protein CW357_04225 [Rummeliibacillus sp. TYF005]